MEVDFVSHGNELRGKFVFHCAAGTSGSECVPVAARYLQIGYTGRRLLPVPCAKFFVRFQRVFLPFKKIKNIGSACSFVFYFAPSREAAKFLKKKLCVFVAL